MYPVKIDYIKNCIHQTIFKEELAPFVKYLYSLVGSRPGRKFPSVTEETAQHNSYTSERYRGGSTVLLPGNRILKLHIPNPTALCRVRDDIIILQCNFPRAQLLFIIITIFLQPSTAKKPYFYMEVLFFQIHIL